MRVAIIGRTNILLEAAKQMHRRGHQIPVIWTCAAESFYNATENDFQSLAKEIDAEFVNETKINTAQNRDRLASYKCDLALSINWLTIIQKPVLDVFPLGVLNAHAGDLPRFRGNACPNWAILAGEQFVGLCIHLMAPQLDAGPVVLRDRMTIDNSTYIGDIYEWLDIRIPEMLVTAAEGLKDGSLPPEPQSSDPDASLRAYPRRPEDSRIQWTWTSQQILRMIRASSRPFAGAFTSLEGERKVTIWRAIPFQHPGAFLAVPGQVCFGAEGDPVVACADGTIRLTEIDLDGMSPEEGKSAILRSLRSRLI